MKQSHLRTTETLVRLAVVTSLIVVALAMSAGSAQAKPPDPPPRALAKNVIIMIADGSGYNHNLAADYYQYGEAGLQVYEDFPFQWAVSTWSADGITPDDPLDNPLGYDPVKAWSDWAYVKAHYTDSAAAATAMACGVKTYDAAIGVDDAGYPVSNIVERSEENGKSTGVISTVEFSHATPAGFVAHNGNRNDYEGIAKEMILESAVDVIMGAGHPWYDNNAMPVTSPNTYKYVGGQITWDALVAGTAGGDADGDGIADPWTLIQEQKQFQDLASGPHPKRVIGVPHAFETLNQGRSGDKMADPYVVPRNQGVPTLAEMSKAALNILDDDPDGLFLMIEGGAVDYGAHGGQRGRTIEERIDFNLAVEAVVEWVQKNSNWGETLLIVTSDHETGYLWGPGSGPTAVPMWKPLVSNGTGKVPGMQFYSGNGIDSTNHTNSLVPLWAKGDAARMFRGYIVDEDPVRGPYITNTTIFEVMLRALVKPPED